MNSIIINQQKCILKTNRQMKIIIRKEKFVSHLMCEKLEKKI